MNWYADHCAAQNAAAADSMTDEDKRQLDGECYYCLAGKVGRCLCTKGYGAAYGNPDPATHTLKQVRINGELEWVPKDWGPSKPTIPAARSWWKLFGY